MGAIGPLDVLPSGSCRHPAAHKRETGDENKLNNPWVATPRAKRLVLSHVAEAPGLF